MGGREGREGGREGGKRQEDKGKGMMGSRLKEMNVVIPFFHLCEI